VRRLGTEQEIRVEIRLNATTPDPPDEQQYRAFANTRPALNTARKITRVLLALVILGLLAIGFREERRA